MSDYDEKIAVLREWINYVLDDEAKFRKAASDLSSREGILRIRNMIAEVGKECTPKEIEEFGLLLKETIAFIDEHKHE